jgi:hypothetical protein
MYVILIKLSGSASIFYNVSLILRGDLGLLRVDKGSMNIPEDILTYLQRW